MSASAFLVTPSTVRGPARRIAVLLVPLALAASCVAVISVASASTAPSAASATPAVATVNALDTMRRAVSTGFGTADLGGGYTVSADRLLSVSGGAGHVAAVAPGHGVAALLPAVVATDEQVQSTFSLPAMPVRGGGVSYGVEVRAGAGGDGYRIQVRVARHGLMVLGCYRVRAGVQTLVGHEVTLGQHAAGGRTILVQGRVTGSAPVVLRARAWVVHAAAPGWQIVANDASARRVTGPGGIGIYGHVFATSGAARVVVAGLVGWSFAVPAPRPPATPTTPAPPVTTAPTTPPATTTPVTTAAPSPTTPAPTTTPSTPTPTPAGPAPAAVRPGPTNTGVPAGTSLLQVTGNMVITTPGATYDGLDVHGFVTIKAADVTIKNSIIRGGVATSGNPGLVTDSLSTATNFVLADSELVPEHPSVAIDGVRGMNYTVLRVNLHGTVDGAKVIGDNVTIEDSWLHDTVSYPSDPYQSGGPTHNDAIQVLSGHNIALRGNTIGGGTNSGLQVTQGNGSVADLAFTGNWADGGACTVNLADKPLATMSDIDVSDNIFGHTSTYKNCAIIYSAGVTMTHPGNTWAGTTDPVALSPRT